MNSQIDIHIERAFPDRSRMMLIAKLLKEHKTVKAVEDKFNCKVQYNAEGNITGIDFHSEAMGSYLLLKYKL